MRSFFIPIFILSFFPLIGQMETSSGLYEGQQLDEFESLSSIAFGSCNNQRKVEEQGIWADVMRNRPDLWLWTGDIIYGDTEDMELMRGYYLQQKNQPYYKALRELIPVIGIWDDHDFGVNDGDKTYPRKGASKQLLFDFLDIDPDHEARRRPGAYHSWTFGVGDSSVKVILLDCRTFRDTLAECPDDLARYRPNFSGDVLGEFQWEWLEKELSESKATVNLIVSGIQFIPEEQKFEKWANFPAARARFFDLLARTHPKNPILISGDRHIAEISAIPVAGYDEMIFEVTSSGMTHTWSDPGKEEPNRYRIGPLVISRNFGVIRWDWSREPFQAIVEIRGPGNELLYQFGIDLQD